MCAGPSTRRPPCTVTSGGRASPGRRPTAPTSSEAPLTSLSGPVAVCVDRPVLSLDRPFTYELPEELGAGVGSLISVPFHGRQTKGWILGPTDDVPDKILPVTKVHSAVRFFDQRMLQLLMWVSERYVAPLASVITRSHPPRVVSEESDLKDGRVRPGVVEAQREDSHPRAATEQLGPDPSVPKGLALAAYRNGEPLLEVISGGQGAFVLRPAPQHEVDAAVETIRTCIDGGRAAILLVPEAEPLPATAAAAKEEFGERAALFVGGDRRERYRLWLEIKAGKYACVIGTGPAVFAPAPDLGLIFVSRESHARHREDRSPYYHVRDVAVARSRIGRGSVVLSAFCPTAEAAALGITDVSPSRRSWPPVEVVPPGTEGRAPRLVAELKRSKSAFLFEPIRGYGVARFCKRCSEPAACSECDGLLRAEAGRVICAVCGARGKCANCGSEGFGVRKGGVERAAEWARSITGRPVRHIAGDEPPPGRDEITIGGTDAVKDVGPLELDVVGILDADVGLKRPGIGAVERALAVWMEASAWASQEGRVILQTRHPADAAVQSLVAGNPERFHRAELARRKEAGFPAGFPVFRVIGRQRVREEIERLKPLTLLATSAGEQTICLVTVRPEDVESFGRAMRSLSDVVDRVEAEPHL
ncbi:MAG: hypothetical protein WD276_05065 [Actinomycetota bacterium]